MPDIVKPWMPLSQTSSGCWRVKWECSQAWAGVYGLRDGRLIQAIEDLGELDNTLIVWVAGDNGGSPFGGPIGSFNQLATFNGVPETMENLLKHFDNLVEPKASGRYTPCHGARRVARPWSADGACRTLPRHEMPQ